VSNVELHPFQGTISVLSLPAVHPAPIVTVFAPAVIGYEVLE
jgi:hypothetical protein